MAVGDFQLRAAHASHKTSVTPYRGAAANISGKVLLETTSRGGSHTNDLKETSSEVEDSSPCPSSPLAFSTSADVDGSSLDVLAPSAISVLFTITPTRPRG